MRLTATTLTFLISVMAGAEPTRHVFVNGGSVPTANYSVHESDLKAFQEALFGSDSRYLNASGPENYLVTVGATGELERTEVGCLRRASLTPRDYPPISLWEKILLNEKLDVSLAHGHVPRGLRESLLG